jgi:hypothetical protein
MTRERMREEKNKTKNGSPKTHQCFVFNTLNIVRKISCEMILTTY